MDIKDLFNNLYGCTYVDTDSLKKDITPEMIKATEDSTKSPHEVEKVKQRFYVDTVESVIYYRYKTMDCNFDAFAKNCFYICDLK